MSGATELRGPSRRAVLAGGAGLVGLALVRPARATPAAMEAAIQAFTGGAACGSDGITLDVPPLVENGNAVPLSIRVDSAMQGDDRVTAVAVFNEKNPLPDVATFRFSALSGAAKVSTRIRLGDSQTIAAVAAMADGTFRLARAELVVTLPACVEN
ncbi:MAG: thiosulfate oxidation carrier protein SoxY [Alsobacter sp.]